MKFFLVSLFSIFSFCASSQIKTFVTVVQSGGAPGVKYIYYTPQKLTWNNFLGTPPPPSEVGAITMSGFGYRSRLSGTTSNGRMDIEVYCFMDPKGSWVRPDKKNDYVLTHEQHHFDITYINAMNFAKQARALKFSPHNTEKLLGDLYKKVNNDIRLMQAAYDMETDHGRKPEVQALWNAKIRELLAAIP